MGEANAIETEYVRADSFLPQTPQRYGALLKDYLEQRIIRYRSAADSSLETDDRIAQLFRDHLDIGFGPRNVSGIVAYGGLPRFPDERLANSQRFSQAAWRNRIPMLRRSLMIAISIFCKLLIGLVAHGAFLSVCVLPVALFICLFRIRYRQPT